MWASTSEEENAAYKDTKLAPTPVRCIMHVLPTSIAEVCDSARSTPETHVGCRAIVKVRFMPQAASHAVTVRRKTVVASHCVKPLTVSRR